MERRDEGASGIRFLDRDGPSDGGPDGADSPGRVVVGVDGSSASVTALRWAAVEARRRGARLAVVVAYRHDITLWPALGSDAWHTATAALERALQEAGLGDDQVERHVLDGTPAAILVAACRGADLLVVGHQSHAPLSRTLLGTVNTDREADNMCPVVVVPPGCVAG